MSQGYDEDGAKAVLAELLEGIDNIESVDILRSIRKLAQGVLKQNPEAIHYPAEKLAAYIKADTGAVREAYDYFLKRHGHRTIREAELRSKSWKNDEEGLMENIRTVMMSGAMDTSKAETSKAASRAEERIAAFLAGKKGAARKGLEYLIRQARDGVFNREYTKSKFVLAVDVFKEAYANLAELLVNAEALPEADLIYFLQHKEIGELIFERKAKLIKKAVQRRRLLDEQMEVRYNEVYVGLPFPITPEDKAAENGLVLSGAPISRGEVKGIARVVKSVADARALKEGEIMVAAFTDIGWSPYYSIIGGLITEVGSALSHGAVVAREYALPLVANVKDATRIIRTGSLVSLNGSTGAVTILETAENLDTEAV
jgi:pyruvate,water dikinase